MTLAFLAALVMAALGCTSLFLPKKMASLLGYGRVSGLGLIEFRATYGAFFLASGLGATYVDRPVIYVVLGCAWLLTGLVRLIAFVHTRTYKKENIAGVCIELGLAICFLFGR